MNPEPSVPFPTTDVPVAFDCSLFPTLCWKSILAGTVAAIGIHLLLSALGVGAGLAVFTPMSDSNPLENFSIGAAIVWTLCALVALGFGGLIAGRFSHSLQSGFTHGVLVWSLTMIITLLLLSMGTGMVLGGAVKILGEGLGIGGKAAAATMGSVAQESIKRGAAQLESFIDEGVHSAPTNSTPSEAIRAKREIGFAITKLFAQGIDPASSNSRQAVVKALTNQAKMSEADAAKTVDDWVSSYQALKGELESAKAMADQKAREAADKAARNLSCAAIWSFFALASGLVVTALCASLGAKRAIFWAASQRSLVS